MGGDNNVVSGQYGSLGGGRKNRVSGKEKYLKHSAVTLLNDEYVEVALGEDDEKYAISISDQSGKLTGKLLLEKIAHPTYSKELWHAGGRGLFIAALYADSFIINTEVDKKTEIIIIINKRTSNCKIKPFWINEK